MVTSRYSISQIMAILKQDEAGSWFLDFDDSPGHS